MNVSDSFGNFQRTYAIGPSVTVVVPVHGRLELAQRCIASIPQWAEVVVVDDGSPQDARSRLQPTCPRARFIVHEEAKGFAGAANAGLEAAGGEVRVVLNSDARLMPGALEALTAAFADPSIGIAGPRLVFPDGSHQTSASRFPTPLRLLTGSFALNEAYRAIRPRSRFPFELGMARAEHRSDRDVDWVIGACIALRDTCLVELGGYDDEYPFYVEETDLCWRARQRGWRVRYVASATVVHEGGASSAPPALLAEHLLQGEARFMVRAYGERSLPRWWASRVLGSAIKASAFGALAPFDSRMRNHAQWQRSALAHLIGTAKENFGRRSAQGLAERGVINLTDCMGRRLGAQAERVASQGTQAKGG